MHERWRTEKHYERSRKAIAEKPVHVHGMVQGSLIAGPIAWALDTNTQCGLMYYNNYIDHGSSCSHCCV